MNILTVIFLLLIQFHQRKYFEKLYYYLSLYISDRLCGEWEVNWFLGTFSRFILSVFASATQQVISAKFL
jgi:hypothetical protein